MADHYNQRMDIWDNADSMGVDDVASVEIDGCDLNELSGFRMNMIAWLDVRVIVVVDVVVSVGVIVGIWDKGRVRNIIDGVSVDEVSGMSVNDKDFDAFLFWCGSCRCSE